MVSEFNDAEGGNVTSSALVDLTELVEDTGKKRRFSLLQKDDVSSPGASASVVSPMTASSKERRRSCYDMYYNYDDYLFDDETVKVEMNLDDGSAKPVTPRGGRGRPMKHTDSHVWTDEATEALIYAWSQKEELFQKQHPLFYVTEAKDRAVEWIRQYLEQRGHTATTNQVTSKFQSLRTYFCSQRNKLINLRKQGAGDDVESKWRFYKDLMFLDQNMKPREKPINKMPHQPMQQVPHEMTHDPEPRDGTEMFPGDGNNGHHEAYSDSSMVVVGMHPHNEPVILQPKGECVSVPEYTNSIETTANGRIKLTPKAHPVSISSTATRTHENSRHHEDLIFGELVGNMMTHIPPGQVKDYLKLEIQQMIVKHKYYSHTTIEVQDEPSNSHNVSNDSISDRS